MSTPTSADARAEVIQGLVKSRAVQAVIWGMPAVNYDLMLQAAIAAGADTNQIVYWSRPLTWKNQTLTPNPNVIYVTPFIDTRDVGAMVLEIPPAQGGAIVGTVDDLWQMPLEDVGLAGVDEGKGGKYLILPPNHEGQVPDGYISMPALTYQTYALLRSNIADDSDAGIAEAVRYAKQIKLYPLSRADNPPATKFVDANDMLFDATIPYDMRFFESLNRVVQAEPWLTRDKVMIDVLKSVGIKKGLPFEPNEETQSILVQGAAEARSLLEILYADTYANPYNVGSRWAVPACWGDVLPEAQERFVSPDEYPVDARGLMYSFVFFAPMRLGAGSFYLLTISDGNGQDLDGSSMYQLHVPANPPVNLYWSVVLYDRDTHALIRDLPSSSLASNMPDLQENADGSVDVWFGPEAPDGMASNWIPTKRRGRFEAAFRFYGPQQPLFEKTWVLPDIQRVE